TRVLLTIARLQEPPFLFADPHDIGRGNRRFKGFVPDLVQKLAAKLKGYRYKIKLVTHGGYGVEDAMGSWNGLVGEVIRGEADVAIGALSIRPSRSAVVDFTTPIMQTGITVVMRHAQGDELSPILRPTDLASQHNISYGCIIGTQTYYYFKNNKAPIIVNMWRNISSSDDNFVATSREGVQRVRESNGTYAFLVESVIGEYLASQPPCELQVLGSLLHMSKYALAVNKNSSQLLKELNRVLVNLKDSGVLDRLRTKWWKRRCDVMTEPLPEVMLDRDEDDDDDDIDNDEEAKELMREHYLQEIRAKSSTSSALSHRTINHVLHNIHHFVVYLFFVRFSVNCD
ncbi:hypothetical protein CAPTEDRAFT_115399, partial [Capitella teleta]